MEYNVEIISLTSPNSWGNCFDIHISIQDVDDLIDCQENAERKGNRDIYLRMSVFQFTTQKIIAHDPG